MSHLRRSLTVFEFGGAAALLRPRASRRTRRLPRRHGGARSPANIVAYGDRIDEDSYAELELRREDTFATASRARS
jgi:hypothetical protein